MKNLLKIFTILILLLAFQPLNFSQAPLYGPDKVKLFTPEGTDYFGHSWPANLFWSIEIDNNGVVWAGSMAQGLFKYENSIWTNFSALKVQDGDILGLEVDDNNNVWKASNSNKEAIELKDTTVSRYPVPDSISPGSGFACVISSGTNIYYAGYDSGLFKFDGSTWTRYSKINDTTYLKGVRSFVKDSKGNIWFANIGNNGYQLVEFDGSNFSIISNGKAEEPKGFLYGLAVDKNDHIWYGTSSNLVMEFDGQNFIPYPPPAGISLTYISAIAVDNYGNKWICTDNRAIYKLKGNAYTEFKFSDMGLSFGQPGSWATDIAVDSRNNLWMATDWGILEFNEYGLNSGTTGIENTKEIPVSFALSQNYPNPFNPTTVIKYQIPKESFVTIKVYDILGRELNTLVNEQKSTGSYEVSFNASSLTSGVYFYKITAGSYTSIKKMVLLK